MNDHGNSPIDDSPDEHLDKLGQRAGKLLRDASLDDALRKSLDQARATALSATHTRTRYLMPVAAAAGMAAIALWAAWPMLVTNPHNDSIIEAISAPANGDVDFALEDLELIATADNFELLEDLEFLQWLDAVEDAG